MTFALMPNLIFRSDISILSLETNVYDILFSPKFIDISIFLGMDLPKIGKYLTFWEIYITSLDI